MRIEGDSPIPPSDLANEGELRGLDSFGKDEIPSTNLRGLEKFTKPAEPTEGEAEDVGEAALEPYVEASKGVLRGLEKFPKPSTEEAARELNPGAQIIQRDSGAIYRIDGITDTRSGRMVSLSTTRDGGGINRLALKYEDLKKKLETEGGTWDWS